MRRSPSAFRPARRLIPAALIVLAMRASGLPAAPNPPQPNQKPDAGAGARAEKAQGPFIPWKGEPGVSVSVQEIMERQRDAPPLGSRIRRIREHPPLEDLLPQNPDSPEVSQWPPSTDADTAQGGSVEPLAPQSPSLSFKAISLLTPHE